MKTKNALYLAGTILVAAAFISLFEKAELIWATLMVIVAVVLLLWGYKKDRQLVRYCSTGRPTKKKIALITVGASGIFFGLGFAIGKLIYLWSH